MHRTWTIGAWTFQLWHARRVPLGFGLGRAPGRFGLVCAHAGRWYLCAGRHDVRITLAA